MGRASATEQPGQRPGGHAPEVNEFFSLDERQTILLAANMRQVQARSAADITVCQELGAACVTGTQPQVDLAMLIVDCLIYERPSTAATARRS